ncbi:hypothetical protein G3M48_003423, partial [Beauveria asiatica]
MGTAEDSATEVGSIGSRHKATLNTTPASASLHNVSDKKQPTAAETTEQISVDDEKAAANDHVSPATPDDDDNDDGVEYPVAWKLGLITIALCLSVFCVAL